MTRKQAARPASLAQPDTGLLEWRLNNPYVREEETKLFAEAFGDLGTRGSVLSVGVGEGTDCPFLREVLEFDMAVGLDLFADNLRLCRTRYPEWRVVCGDGTMLPFADGSFELVYCKDVCHHVEAPTVLIAEMFRVLRPGGELVLMEANGSNPVFFVFGMLVPQERLVWRTGARQLREWICSATGERSSQMELRAFQALPLWRAALHYRFGWPGLARWRPIAAALRLVDSLGSRVVPVHRWAYLVARVRKQD